MRTSTARPALAAAVAVGLAALALAPASAEAADLVETEAELTHEPHNALGIKALGLAAVMPDGDVETGGGANVFYERSLVHHWLELELSAGVLQLHDHTFVPIELVLEVPFASKREPGFVPYVGLGALIEILAADAPEIFPGTVAVAGGYIWLSEHWGLDFDLTWSMVFEHGHVVHEVIPALGPSVRF